MGDIYQVHIEDPGSNVTVSIRHRFLDAPEAHRWLVRSTRRVGHRRSARSDCRVRTKSCLNSSRWRTAPSGQLQALVVLLRDAKNADRRALPTPSLKRCSVPWG